MAILAKGTWTLRGETAPKAIIGGVYSSHLCFIVDPLQPPAKQCCLPDRSLRERLIGWIVKDD